MFYLSYFYPSLNSNADQTWGFDFIETGLPPDSIVFHSNLPPIRITLGHLIPKDTPQNFNWSICNLNIIWEHSLLLFINMPKPNGTFLFVFSSSPAASAYVS
jgi:hypothetical protein